MDYGALPPEVNSARMYAGPGPESLRAAAAGWNQLAVELHSAASGYGSVIAGLTDGPWMGPSSGAMAAAAAPYVAWLNTTAGQAELTAAQAQAAAGAYEGAFSMTVPPPAIAANRAQLASLVSTNYFGQNTAAIAANEAQYSEMWAQDAAAMYNYAANSAAITKSVTPVTAPPETTNAAGLVAQHVRGATTATGGGAQSALSSLVTTVPNALNGLASPGSSTSGLLGGITTTTGTQSLLSSMFSPSSMGSMLQSLALEPVDLAGFGGMFMGVDALGTLFGTPMSAALTATPAALAGDVGAAEGVGAAVAAGDLGAAVGAADALGGASGLGAMAGLGEAASVGGLAVPANWGWAATAPAGMLGSMPLMAPVTAAQLAGATDLGAGLGFPFMFPGLPTAAARAGGAVGSGKYGLPVAAVMTRPPAAGYGPTPDAAPAAKYPVPAQFPADGHAPPGYQPAIVYLPTNGHAKSNA
ncbi:MAG: PPE family protein [Mycobacterium sp.]|nr:PPE family protein [Mycobacterium sp.]